MGECANCKTNVDQEKSNLFTQPLPLLITLYDEEGVSTREKGEVSVYEALVDVFSLRSNAQLIRLLEAGMHPEDDGDETDDKCMLSLCHECAFRLANLYELCQEFTQLSVKAHSFLYPIIAKVTVKAELLEDTVEDKSEAAPTNEVEDGVVLLVDEITEKTIKTRKKNQVDGNESTSVNDDTEAPYDDDQYYPMSPQTNHEDVEDSSDSDAGGVAERVKRRIEKLALRKAAGGDINSILEVTNDDADWLSSSDSEDEDNETSDESYVESEPETKQKRRSSDKVKGPVGDDNPDAQATPSRTPRRNRVKEKITCPKCGQQYVNRACYEKHMRRHKTKYRRIRKGPANASIKKEKMLANRGDEGDNIPLVDELENDSIENDYPSGASEGEGEGEGEEIIAGGRLRKRWRITDEEDEWSPKKRKGNRKSGDLNNAVPVEPEEKVRVPCTVCGNTFMSNGHLVQHMKTHTKPKNACILCGKEYRYPSELKVHLESHQRMKEKRMNSNKLKTPGENVERLFNSDFSDDGEVPSPIPMQETSENPFGNTENLEGMEVSGDVTVNPAETQGDTQGDEESKSQPMQIVTCTVCRKHFRHPHFLQMHMQTHSKAIKCTQCPEVFTTPKDLREHKIAHRIERRATIEPMACKYCGKQYYDETHLFRHQESHELPPPLFPCEICGKQFTRKQKLKLHIDTVHTTERPYRCHLCPLAYSRKDKLNAHITKAHGEELKCDLCGKSFIGEASLKVHRVKHAFEAPREFSCEQCGRKYQQMKHLKNHIKFMHRKRTANVCQTCGKTFGRASCLKKHEISHQEIGSHLCSQCGKSYKHERSLILHEQKEHLGESSYQYECTVCLKRFHRKELLQNHQVSENHMAAGSIPVLVTTSETVEMRDLSSLPLPEHFLQMPMPTTGMSEMLNCPMDNSNQLDLIHAATSATTDPDKYRSALSGISEATSMSMFVAQNF